MADSLIGSGGVATIPNTVSAATPSVLFDESGSYGVNADGGACEAYIVENLDTTNWIFVRIPQLHTGTDGVPIGPGKSVTFVYQSNFIKAVFAWATAPTVGGGATTAVVGGGFQKKV